jgi:hypothetical protein
MRQLLIWVGAFFFTWVAIVTLAVVVLRWRLQRMNRVSPAMRSPAPIVWLWSPRQPARLHRRLRLAIVEIHLAPSRRRRDMPSLSVDDLRRELEYQAVELDHHLVTAAHHPKTQRRSLLRQLQGQVSEVERLSIRLSRMRRANGSPSSGWDLTSEPPEVLAHISQQLDLLDQAQEELTEIERAVGLVDVDRLLAPTKQPVAAPQPVPANYQPTIPRPRRSTPR